MLDALESVKKVLKKLPGLGYRSAERLALHLLVEKPEELPKLIDALQVASTKIKKCSQCGSIAEDTLCRICSNSSRNINTICIIEHVMDMFAMERAGTYKGTYHILHGKLSPMKGIGPESLNLLSLKERIRDNNIEEIILALSNDIEGEATCHYIQDEIIKDLPIKLSRIGFGLPSGSSLLYADSATLESALEGRRSY